MSKVHILEFNNYSCKIAIHFPVPTGTNSAGFSWKAVGLSSSQTGTTILIMGNDPGEITQAEYDSIINGDTVEIIKQIDPGLTPSNISVNKICDVLISMWKQDMANNLKYYGHTIEGM